MFKNYKEWGTAVIVSDKIDRYNIEQKAINSYNNTAITFSINHHRDYLFWYQLPGPQQKEALDAYIRQPHVPYPYPPVPALP